MQANDKRIKIFLEGVISKLYEFIFEVLNLVSTLNISFKSS